MSGSRRASAKREPTAQSPTLHVLLRWRSSTFCNGSFLLVASAPAPPEVRRAQARAPAASGAANGRTAAKGKPHAASPRRVKASVAARERRTLAPRCHSEISWEGHPPPMPSTSMAMRLAACSCLCVLMLPGAAGFLPARAPGARVPRADRAARLSAGAIVMGRKGRPKMPSAGGMPGIGGPQAGMQQTPQAPTDGVPVFYLYCRSGPGKPWYPVSAMKGTRRPPQPQEKTLGARAGPTRECARARRRRRAVQGTHQRVAQLAPWQAGLQGPAGRGHGPLDL